jgi:hypothetical protein
MVMNAKPQPTTRRPNRSDSPPAATMMGMPGSPATTSIPAAVEALSPRSVWRKSRAKVWACWVSWSRKVTTTTRTSQRRWGGSRMRRQVSTSRPPSRAASNRWLSPNRRRSTATSSSGGTPTTYSHRHEMPAGSKTPP